MDINDQIFEAVKKNLEEGELNTTEDQNLFVKICLGTATQEEIDEFNKTSGVDEEVSQKLKEYCNIGHNMAAQFDNNNDNNNDNDQIDIILSELKEIKEMLRHKESKNN